MADTKIVKEWLDKDDEDFNFAQANLKDESNFYAQICFHFHQSAEKYPKAFIVAYELKFEKIHNLINLLKICATKEPSILSILDNCIFLNTSYIDTRYPVHWLTNYTKEKALESKKSTQEIAEMIKGLLKEEGYV